MTQKIQTVNVVEYKRATDDMSVHSFNDNDEGTVFYRHDFGTYYSYSIIEGTMDKPVRKIAEDSDGQKKISDFVKVIPTILRNIAN